MIIVKDTLEQLAIALVFCLICTLLTSVKQPYRQLDNDYFALACNFGLTVTFFFTITLKVTDRTRPQTATARTGQPMPRDSRSPPVVVTHSY